MKRRRHWGVALSLAFGCLSLVQVAWGQSEGLQEANSIMADGEKVSNPLLNNDPFASSPQQADATGESRTRIDSDRWSEFKRNIRVMYFNFATNDMRAANENGGRFESYNYFSINYRLSRTERIALRPAFFLNGAGRDFRGQSQESQFSWSDAYFNYTNYALKLLPLDMTYITNVRVYLPTSQMSQDRGMIARIRPYFIATAPITSRLLYAIHFQPDFYFQKRTGFLNERGFPRGNKNYGYETFAELTYRFGPIFTFGINAGHEQMWTHSMPAENQDVFRTENLTASVSLGIMYGGLLTAVGVTQSRDLTRPRNQFSLFRDDESQYFARSFYRF